MQAFPIAEEDLEFKVMDALVHDDDIFVCKLAVVHRPTGMMLFQALESVELTNATL